MRCSIYLFAKFSVGWSEPHQKRKYPDELSPMRVMS